MGIRLHLPLFPKRRREELTEPFSFALRIQPLLCWLGSDYGYIIDADDADDDVDGIADG